MSVRDVLQSAWDGRRISAPDALALLGHASLPELAWAADRVCRAKHPEPVRTYVIDRNINYTNICVSGCRFCAFYRPPGDPEGYVLTTDQILDKIAEAVELGATQILMQGGLHPELDIEYYEDLLKAIKTRFGVQVHCLSAPEIAHVARTSGLGVRETLSRLRAAVRGVDVRAEPVATAIPVEFELRRRTIAVGITVVGRLLLLLAALLGLATAAATTTTAAAPASTLALALLLLLAAAAAAAAALLLLLAASAALRGCRLVRLLQQSQQLGLSDARLCD